MRTGATGNSQVNRTEMVLLQNESVKWACRGFLPTEARHPVCQDSSWALPAVWPCQPCGLRHALTSYPFSEALALPSSWGCCGALRRWQVEKCPEECHHNRSRVPLESSLEHGAAKGNPSTRSQ